MNTKSEQTKDRKLERLISAPFVAEGCCHTVTISLIDSERMKRMTLSQAKEKVAEHRPDLSKKEQMKIAQQVWLGWLLSMNIPGALLSAAAIIISLIALLK